MSVRGQPTKWDAWYSSQRWARIRKHQLLEYPLCKYCLERGIVRLDGWPLDKRHPVYRSER